MFNNAKNATKCQTVAKPCAWQEWWSCTYLAINAVRNIQDIKIENLGHLEKVQAVGWGGCRKTIISTRPVQVFFQISLSSDFWLSKGPKCLTLFVHRTIFAFKHLVVLQICFLMHAITSAYFYILRNFMNLILRISPLVFLSSVSK